MEYLSKMTLLARVPEHSLPLMTGMSGGTAFCIEPYLFFSYEDWLMAIAYPLKGKYSHEDFRKALAKAIEQTSATSCFAIGSKLPPELEKNIIERDRFYLIDSNMPVPPKLRGVVRQASEKLKITESTEFTPSHRRLWTEFLESHSMKDRVAELYTRTPQALAHAKGSLRLLSAWDQQGNLAATLLLDYYPEKFVSYILGAHSRQNYTPHAMDLLFSKMLDNARKEHKRFIHLGLGVNDGILRFKRKWGAKPYFPYLMAQWEQKQSAALTKEDNVSFLFAKALLSASSDAVSARQFLANLPEQKPYAMLWQVEKKGRKSWIGGTAHFFCYSFEDSFKKLFQNVDNVLFEGPLDPVFMSQVEAAGKILPSQTPPIIDSLNTREIEILERTVLGPKNKIGSLFNPQSKSHIDIRWLLSTCNYWYAFFTLWTTFLERQGWRESVDMEAWRVANDMGKNVIGMENLDEQLESLGSLPLSRVVNFFKDCKSWKKRASNNRHAYLAGDLEKMMGSSAEFPTRTEHVVGRRDERFRQRMRQYLEAGRCAVFVGTAHMINLRHMLAEDGFRVTQKPFGIWPRLHLKWRSLTRPDEKVKW